MNLSLNDGIEPETDSEVDEDRWLAAWYMPTSCDALLRDVQRSAIVYGVDGAGKTAALHTMTLALQQQALIVPIDWERAVNQAEQATGSADHFGLAMKAAAQAVQRQIEKHGEILPDLSRVQLSFLHWLLRKHLRPRELELWVDKLRNPSLDNLLQADVKDLYPDDSTSDDVRSQIEELIHLAHGLGYEAVVLVFEITTAPADATVRFLADWVGWLEPWQHRGFVLKGALPSAYVKLGNLEARARGRIALRKLTWDLSQCRELAIHRLCFRAVDEARARSIMANDSAVGSLAEVLADIGGEHTPKCWIAAADQLASTAATYAGGALVDNEIRRSLYRTLAPLRIDSDRQGVWRGQHFVALSDQLFRIFSALWKGGVSVDWEKLREIAGTKDNVNTLVHRLRRELEPVPGDPIYICRVGPDHFALEHTLR
jgi:predicted ATPase